MSSLTDGKIKLSVFGESHGPAIGVTMDGLPAGISLDMDFISFEMARRAPGNDPFSTSRKEADAPEILSGVLNGCTTGAPLCAVIRNTNAKSMDYENVKLTPRPSHADYTAHIKYSGYEDIRGGGHFSGRLTAPIVFAGAVLKLMLASSDIFIGAHIERVGSVLDERFDPVRVSPSLFGEIAKKDFPVIKEQKGEMMKREIEDAKKNLDSVGGCIECAVTGVPAGLGGPLFSGVEGALSKILFGIPAVKGVEFGDGFALSSMRGSLANDAYTLDHDEIETLTNHNGGILGGITSGMPIIFRVAVKPTPSIAREQDSVELLTRTPSKLTIKGRHDPCIVKRAVSVVEACAAIGISNLVLGA